MSKIEACHIKVFSQMPLNSGGLPGFPKWSWWPESVDQYKVHGQEPVARRALALGTWGPMKIVGLLDQISLVGSWPTPLKNITVVSWDDYFQYIYINIEIYIYIWNKMFQTTNPDHLGKWTLTRRWVQQAFLTITIFRPEMKWHLYKPMKSHESPFFTSSFRGITAVEHQIDCPPGAKHDDMRWLRWSDWPWATMVWVDLGWLSYQPKSFGLIPINGLVLINRS